MPAWQVGDVTIERVEEFSSPGFHPSQQFPDFDPSIFDTFPELRDIDRIDPQTGSTFASIHAWLVRHGGEIILVEETAALMRKMGRTEVTIGIAEPLPAVPPGLEDWTIGLSEDGCVLTATLGGDGQSGDTGVADLLKALAARGIDARTIAMERSSLEDIFVDLVGRRP